MKVSCRSPRLIVAALSAVTLFAGCPLPYDYAGRGAGSSHTTDPSSPTITASVTVAYSEQGGTSGVIPNNGSYTTGKTTTVTLSTTTENAIIYYTVDGSQITDFGTPKKITVSSGQLTVTRSTSVQTVDIHAVVIGPNMMPSQAVHAHSHCQPLPDLFSGLQQDLHKRGRRNRDFHHYRFESSTADITVKLLTGGMDTSADLTGLPASGASFSATLVHSTTTVSIPITGVHNPANANPTATLTLQPDPNTPPTYTVGLPASASVVIQNDASHTVTYNGNGNSGGAVPTDSNFYLPCATVTVRGNSGNLAKTGQRFCGVEHASERQWHHLYPGPDFRHERRQMPTCMLSGRPLMR